MQKTMKKRHPRRSKFSFPAAEALPFLLNALWLLLAGAVNAVAIGFFLSPSKILDGGISGTSIFLSHLTRLPLAVYIICLNVPFFLMGIKRLGWLFIVNSLIGISSYALCVFLIGKRPPISEHLILVAVFGGLCSGVGSGLMIRKGGCVDGIEITAVLFAKRLNLTVGQMVMIYNAVMMALSIPFFGVDRALFSVLAYAVGLKAVDGVVDGLDKAKAVLIISSNGESVAAAISEQFKRGITVMPGRGFYSGQDRSVLYVILNRFEISGLVALIQAVDPEAFVSITEISEVVSSKYEKRPQRIRGKLKANRKRGSNE